MKHQKIISIPLSIDALHRLNYDTCLSGDLIDIKISDEEFDILLKIGVFNAINKALNINIGEYEDELIFVENINHLKTVVTKFIDANPDNRVLKKFIFICNIAFSLETGIFFSF